VQFSVSDKVKILQDLGLFNQILESLFLNKDLNKEQDRNEIIHKLINEAHYQYEREVI